MNFMDRLPRPKAMAGPTDDSWYFPGGSFYGGLPTLGGLPITSDMAMRIMTVQKCVRVRAATMALLPCHVFERLGEDDFREATDFYLYKLLNDRPNSWMQSPIFWAMVEAFVCLRGNFIAYKLGIEGGPVLGLLPITDIVTKVEQKPDYSLIYHVRLRNGETKEYPQSRIFHIRGLLTLDGIMGANPVEYSREQFGISASSIRFLNQFFEKGMHPGAIITIPERLKTEDHINLREAMKKVYGGLGNSQDLMLLEHGSTINFPTIKLVDAQFLEIMKMGHDDICGLYRVPPMLVQGGNQTPTFASSEQFDLNYSKYGVAPDCRNYAKTVESDLMTTSEQKKYYVKFNLDGLLAGDFKTRMDGFVAGVNAEIFCPNDARKKMEMRPYEGGDTYRSRTSTIKQDNTPDEGKKGAATK